MWPVKESKEKTDASFLDAVKRITKMTFNTTTEAKNWLLMVIGQIFNIII